MNQDPCILYVEDDPMSRSVMEMLLVDEMKLSNVIIFEDSSDFVERVTNIDPKPDVILLDIHMKPYTGFEMLAMLREMDQFEATPIVALTASVMNEEVAQLKGSGFDGCISKPIDMDVFPNILDTILQGRKIWRIG